MPLDNVPPDTSRSPPVMFMFAVFSLAFESVLPLATRKIPPDIFIVPVAVALLLFLVLMVLEDLKIL